MIIANILVISHKFYPNKDIGARRWTKLSEELISRGISLHILSRDYGALLNDNHHYYRSYHPDILSKKPITLLRKIEYNFWIRLLPVLTKSNFYDRTILSQRKIISKARAIIKEQNIRIIITTGAPFSLCYYGVLLKKEFPELKIVSDLRDPWTWNNGYGFNIISEKHRNNELLKEKSVIEGSDLILVPVKPMHDYLIQHYPHQKEKIKILPHFFDIRKMPKKKLSINNTSSINFIYGGTVYNGVLNWYKRFAKCAYTLSEDISVDIFSNDNTLDLKLENGLTLKKGIDEHLLFQEISKSKYYIACYPERYKDFISTKFYEIIYLRIPIVLISPKGILSDFIVSNELGVHILPNNIESQAPRLLNETFNFNENFDIEKFSLSHVTDDLIKLLK